MPSELDRGRDTDALQLQYEKARPDFVRLTAKLESLFQDLLAARGISIHLIESRTKEVASFREKIVRASKAYVNPLRELTDLSGVRIIAYYQDDADAICALIREEFLLLEENGPDSRAAPEEFGYRSAHLIVQLSDARANLVEWGGLAGLTAEVRVRTVLQHAWAAISHKLQYKREQDVPVILRRKLSRLSALFEIADDEFLSLRRESGDLVNKITEKLSVGDQDIPLHQLSVAEYVGSSKTLVRICEIASDVGFRFERDFDEPDDDAEMFSEIIHLAGIAGVRTIAELDDVLAGTVGIAAAYLSAQYHAEGETEPGKWGATPGFICVLMLIGAKAQHIRVGILVQLGWDDGIAGRVLKVAKGLAADGA